MNVAAPQSGARDRSGAKTLLLRTRLHEGHIGFVRGGLGLAHSLKPAGAPRRRPPGLVLRNHAFRHTTG